MRVIWLWKHKGMEGHHFYGLGAVTAWTNGERGHLEIMLIVGSISILWGKNAKKGYI